MLLLIASIALMYLVVISAGLWAKRRQQDLDRENARTH